MAKDDRDSLEALKSGLDLIKDGRCGRSVRTRKVAASAAPRAGEARKRILIVDNDEGSLILLQHLLEDAGYDACAAWSGTEAVSLLHKGVFDLVLLNDHLADLSCDEVLRQLARLQGAVPVFVLQSGPLPEELASNFIRLGARFFVNKYHPKEVTETVKAFLVSMNLLIN